MTGLSAAGCYLVCRKLRGADGRFLPERNLDGRLAPAKIPEPVPQPQPAIIAPDMGKAETSANLLMTGGGAIEKQVVIQVVSRPGMFQAEFHALLPALSRKQLQELLLRLDRQGVLKRVPEKGTYRLFPAG